MTDNEFIVDYLESSFSTFVWKVNKDKSFTTNISKWKLVLTPEKITVMDTMNNSFFDIENERIKVIYDVVETSLKDFALKNFISFIRNIKKKNSYV